MKYQKKLTIFWYCSFIILNKRAKIKLKKGPNIMPNKNSDENKNKQIKFALLGILITIGVLVGMPLFELFH